jgi:ATP-binding cassette, subfamily B, bacterial PglK
VSLLSDIWAVLIPKQRRALLAAQALALLMAASTVTGVASIAPFFAVLGNPSLIDRNPVLHSLYGSWGFTSYHAFVTALGLGFVGLIVLANVMNLLGGHAMLRLSWWIGTELQSSLFAEYLNRPYAFHAGAHSAKLSNNIINETARLTNDVLQGGLNFVSNAVTALFILIAMVLFGSTIALAMIGTLAAGYVVIYLVVRNRLLRCGRIQTDSVIQQTRVAHETFGAIKEVLVFGVQDFFKNEFERASRNVAAAVGHTQQVAQSPRPIMECVAVAGLVGLTLALSGTEQGLGPWLGQLTFAGFSAYRLLPTLQQAFAALVKVRAARAGFASIAPDLRLARSRPPRLALENTEDQPRTEITLRDVSFRYAPGRTPAVANISLAIPARSAVGLVGANGSGKTTLVDIIAGLLVPDSGERFVNGSVAYVPQHIFLLDTTIAENIALGIPREAIDAARLKRAAQLAQLDELVATLPGQYEHVVGERGMRLSGGQRQRIGIARALYANASVLILDEATNALDGSTEQELVATLVKLRGLYTVVLIAHRLSTLRSCDMIFELQAGRLIAQGTYAELLNRSQTFRQLAGAS